MILHRVSRSSFVTAKPAKASHPTPTPLEEQSVIAAVRNGDQRAFAWLVRRYEHMVFTICDRVLRNREETEEAAQDAFVKAYQNMASYAGEAKFSTWLYSIAFRTAISKLRSRKGGSVDLADVPESVASTWDDPASEHQDRKKALDQALAQLPAEDAAVVTLFYLADQSVEEIVTATGLSASNVKVKLHRSRKKLFGSLHHQLKEEVWSLQ